MGEVRPALVRCDLEGEPSGDDTADPVGRFAKPTYDLPPLRSVKCTSRQKCVGKLSWRLGEPTVAFQKAARSFDLIHGSKSIFHGIVCS